MSSLTPQTVPTARQLAKDREPSVVFHTGTNRPYVNGDFINMDNHKPIFPLYPKKIKIGKMPDDKRYPNSIRFQAWEKIATPSSNELLGQAIVDAQNKSVEKMFKQQERMSSGIPSLAVDESGFKTRKVQF